ncbi:PREDICTED: cation/H(+) antiporter 28-like [Ipomoea nil]|uniref:cation/H(+) antiporter 28-like n=1 Tax=Ipomoea nil TaxID=35883 RepID=UPI000900B090|nr:PREDICTED: cation/H(+) antiporter 28-like [Ipomoea nil]
MDFLKNNAAEEARCQTAMTVKMASIAVYALGFFVAMVLCNFVHFLLRPISQPRIISEAVVGLFLSNIRTVRKYLDEKDIKDTLSYIVDVIMICHMFVVGLEIDPNIFQHLHLPETKVAYSGVLATFILANFLVPSLKMSSDMMINIGLCLVLSGTASPLLTRIITDLKIGKSDIGRFVVAAGVHSDVVSTILISLGYIAFDPFENFQNRNPRSVAKMATTLVLQTALAKRAAPVVMNWVNHENPEGKSMKGSHLVITIAFVVLVCSTSPYFGEFNKVLSAFLAGLFMPRDGRISRMMITKVNYVFTTIFYPLFFLWVGSSAHVNKFGVAHWNTWINVVCLFVITTVGKVVGSLVSGVMLGFHWPESVAIGLLLNTKGHFQVFLGVVGLVVKSTFPPMKKLGLSVIPESVGLPVVFMTFLTIVYTPLVVAKIISWARKRSPSQRMALQLLSASDELRVLLCLRGKQNVSCAINFIEISRGPVDPGIMIYLTEMIELTDRVAATMASGNDQGAVDGVATVADPEVVRLREEINSSVQAYVPERSEGINVKQMMALSTLNSMHQDVCILAEDLMVHLVVMPFHKNRTPDGKLDTGNSGFRHVNRKVLRHAPCSVGILVDRGLGAITISTTSICLNAAVIFIGGKDDREALSYVGRVARHPGVKLTVIRFLLEAGEDSVAARISKAKANTAEHQEEMKLDDECFAKFYDRHVAGGRVAYREKYLVNSGQTFSTLRSLEGQYELFIVGRGGRVNSVLTVGMNDWEECPELGLIGDILSASDYSVATSVLIIQQHSFKGEIDGLQEEFSIM